ncbi:MAG: hypothetical protein F4110_03810 [Acidimicrobiaceae bacterium]|nr:hypothetical protein [Acidimicrobiaceae bacterium]MYE98560.1 hypothetical protein [Acidimicrobiaceae bacterium]MYI53101.1 hypothetical protein [Acidimicrobiaceae bacterium]
MIGERGPGWGIDFGAPGEIPPDALAAGSDAAAGRIVAEARRANRAIPPVVLTGGDLARTLGLAPARTASSPSLAATGARFEVDVGAALVDGRLHWFVAHLVARRSWWRGRVLVAANASFIGRWNAAPRSHPGDGRLDMFDADPPLAVRLAARRRLPSGTHVPHPRITQRRIAAAQYDLDPVLDAFLDGVRLGRARTLSLRVEPGALEVWIPGGA